MKVLQILNDGILAHLCPTEFSHTYKDAFDACVVDGDLVYMPVKRATNDYVDDQKVSLSEDQCFTANGTYSYATANQMKKRVRKIKIISAQTPIPNSGADKTK